MHYRHKRDDFCSPVLINSFGRELTEKCSGLGPLKGQPCFFPNYAKKSSFRCPREGRRYPPTYALITEQNAGQD